MSVMADRILGWCLAVWLATAAGCAKTQADFVEVEAKEGKNRVRAVIGREGGTLRLFGQGARLEVPTKLLQEEVTITLQREEPSFDLSGKDFVGRAYRISPRLDFTPGSARLYVPLDKTLPGSPAKLHFQIYYYDRLESEGPEGAVFVHAWQVHPKTKFAKLSQDRNYLVFDLYETISDRTTKAPYGLFQAAFDLP